MTFLSKYKLMGKEMEKLILFDNSRVKTEQNNEENVFLLFAFQKVVSITPCENDW